MSRFVYLCRYYEKEVSNNLKRKDIRQIFTHKTYKTNEKVF